jgi:hypothetical protein
VSVGVVVTVSVVVVGDVPDNVVKNPDIVEVTVAVLLRLTVLMVPVADKVVVVGVVVTVSVVVVGDVPDNVVKVPVVVTVNVAVCV